MLSPPSTPVTGKPWGLRILSAIYAALVLPSLVAAFGALFMFDAPGSQDIVALKVLAIALFILPAALIVSAIGTLACSFGNRRFWKIATGRVFGALPMLNVLLIVIAIIVLQQVCPGQEACHR